jgi:hypothetical protein
VCGHGLLKLKVLAKVEGERREHTRFGREHEMRGGLKAGKRKHQV